MMIEEQGELKEHYKREEKKFKMRYGACYASHLSNCHVDVSDSLGFASLGPIRIFLGV